MTARKIFLGELDESNKPYDNFKDGMLFRKNVQLNKSLNEKIPVSSDNNLRIMTWNVRYFTDINNNPTFNKICEVINTIKPDILCLNEVTFGHNDYYDDKEQPNLSLGLSDYRVLSYCSNVPSWFSALYGNMILIRKQLFNNYKNTLANSSLNVCNKMAKCFFNQRIYTFEYPIPKKQPISGVILENVEESETRCFIKITLGEYDLICTHLEAYDRNIRQKQFEELFKHVTRPTIIVGDMNIINTGNYIDMNKKEREWDELKRYNFLNDDKLKNEIYQIKEKYGLIDSFEITNNVSQESFSTWTNTVVDYIFLTKEWKNLDEDLSIYLPVGSYTYYTDVTDHLPIIFDIFDTDILGIKEYGNNASRINTMRKKDDELSIIKLNQYIKFDTNNFDNPDIEKLRMYNVEPLIAYNWFDNGKVNHKIYTFTDPFLTGNFRLSLGGYGVYVGLNDKDTVKLYIGTLNNRTDQVIRQLDDTSLRFTFKVKKNSDIKIMEQYDNFANYDDKYDLLIVGGIADSANKVGKMTQRKYNKDTGEHEIFELEKIHLIVETNNTIHAQYQMTSALEYIKEKNIGNNYLLKQNGYATTIEINKITQAKYYLEYEIWNKKITGGNNYYYKYQKYKNEYLQLKN